jgi:hypothetical protein
MGLPAKKVTPQAFPKDQVEAALRGWWARQKEAICRIADPVPELQPDSATVFSLVPLVSSHHALDAVLDIEKIVGYEIPDSVVKRGGYQSGDEFVEHMMGKLAAFQQSRNPHKTI